MVNLLIKIDNVTKFKTLIIEYNKVNKEYFRLIDSGSPTTPYMVELNKKCEDLEKQIQTLRSTSLVNLN